MLEFILFLSSGDKEILKLLYEAGFFVTENTPECLISNKFFGFFKKSKRTIIICTKNAMKIGGYFIPKTHEDTFDPTKIYIKKALRHEAVHAAQLCNNGQLLNMVDKSKMKLHPFKKEALEGSTKFSGNRLKEYEAYWMEDRPKLVKKALKKYCL